MEGLYTKLYNKYSKLKREKDGHMEKLNREQEEKFMNYWKIMKIKIKDQRGVLGFGRHVSYNLVFGKFSTMRQALLAADEMIEYLRSENDRLGKQVTELRSEMALVRSTKDEECIQYQRALMEENKKNKELSEEIERLNNLQREGLCCQAKGDKVDNGPLEKHGSSPAVPSSSMNTSERMTRKRTRQYMNGGCIKIVSCATKEVEPVQLTDTADSLYKQIEVGDVLPNYCLPVCCKRINCSGDKATESGSSGCMFQDLVEFAIGMKLSAVVQDEAFCVSVLHPSSGYSFSLTWVDDSSGKPELLYRLLSLGTFERVAPEWMRDVLMFSTSMCPIFFERVSRVIKLNH